MSFPNAIRSVLATGLALVVLVGCSSNQWLPARGKTLAEVTADSTPDKSDGFDESRPKNKFRWDGGGVVLGEVDQPAMTADEFKTALDTLHEQQRQRSFRNLVRRYPDLAWETIQATTATGLRDPVLHQLAQDLDSFLSPTGPYFAPLYQQSDGQLATYLEKRAKCWRAIQSGEPETAAKLNLWQHKPRPDLAYLRLDAARLTAIAHMMSGETEAAIRIIEQAVRESQTAPPYVVTNLLLLQGEIYRHAGRHADWQASWLQAVDEHARLAATGVADPQFWHRAAFARPAALPWSDTCIEMLQQLLAERGFAFRAGPEAGLDDREAAMWGAVGLFHLDRDEGQSAVLCFKKSEALVNDRQTAAVLQLHQARGLILAGQPGPASSILIRLIAQHADSDVASRAQAVLGAIKVHNGAIAQGQKLLETALAGSAHWPRLERDLAAADLALVKLMTGHAEEGLAELEQAYAAFVAHRAWDHAFQCLWNLARYHELTEQTDAHYQAQLRVANFESQGD